MAITVEQVRTVLDSEEPDYSRVKALGSDALPILERLVHGSDQMLASKAAYAAGVIGGPEAAAVLSTAAKSPNPAIRVAAASGAKLVADPAITSVLLHLLNDADSGIRRQALRAAAGRADPTLQERVNKLSTSDMDPTIRKEASTFVRKP